MNNRQKISIFCALAAILCMTACGDDKVPASYQSGETSLPSLTELVELPEDYQCEETQDEETGSATYTYSGLENAGETVKEYTDLLTKDYNCTLVQKEDFSKSSGAVVAGVDSEAGDGMMELSIAWDEQSCSVTPSFTEGKSVTNTQEPMTLKEILDFFSTISLQYLGLDPNGSYSVIPEDGIVMVDGSPCICLDVYYSDTHQIAGTYIVSQQCDYVYRLDRSNNTVSVVFPNKINKKS